MTIDDQDWSFEKPWVEARRKGDRPAMARIGEEYQEALHVEVRDQEERGDRIFGRPAPQILLLHANEVGAAQWDRLFTWLEGRGYRFARADEVLADPAFAEDPRYVGPSGFGLWDRIAAVRRAGTPRAPSRRCSRRSRTPGTAATSTPSPRSTPRTPPSSPPPASPRAGGRCWSATAAAIRTARRWER